MNGRYLFVMKALIFDGRKLNYFQDYPEPNNDEALIKVRLAGICGTDLEILDGYMSHLGILGHEFIGTVVKSKNPDLLGKRVVGEINVGCEKCDSCTMGMQRHCPNRSVLGILNRNGAFAEYLSLPEKNLHVIPDSISDEQAVFVEPIAAAFEINEQVSLKSNWKIAIVGDGRLARLIVAGLKTKCNDITCFGKHEDKLNRLNKMKIKTKIGISDKEQHYFDLVVEATGSNSGFFDAIKLVKPRGSIILKSTIASKENLDLTPAVVNEITLVGSRCGPFRPAIEAIGNGLISVDGLVHRVYPLNKFQEAFDEAQKSNVFKILLKP